MFSPAGYACLWTKNLSKGRNSFQRDGVSADYDYASVLDVATIAENFHTPDSKECLVRELTKSAKGLADLWNQEFGAADNAGKRLSKQISYQVSEDR